MKAWLVREKDEPYTEIVFAETRGKAKSLALGTDCFGYTDFIDIEARRIPKADKYYKDGKWHLDFENQQDRLIMVKEFGFICDYESIELKECKKCCAKEYCNRYSD